MAKDDQPEPTQTTQPRGIDPETGKPYEPVEIPVPKREDFFGVLKRAFAGKNAQGHQTDADTS